MLTCNSCGTVHEEPVRFCPECGARLDDSPSPTEIQAAAEEQPAEGDKPGRVTVRLPELDQENIAALTAEPETPPPSAAAEPEPTIDEPAPPEPAAPPAATLPATAPSEAALPQSPSEPQPPELSRPAAEIGQRKPDNRLIWLIAGGTGCLAILLIGICLGLLLLFNLAGVFGSSQQPAPAKVEIDGTSGATASGDANQLLLADNFSNATQSSLGSGSDAETSYRFVDGAYQIEVLPAEMLAWSRIDGQYRDVQIEFDARLIDGPAETGIGLIFRYQDADNFYLFTVSGDGFYNLEMVSNGRWQTLIDWTAAPAIQPFGKINRLSVTTVEDRITLGINGVVVDETLEPRFAAGAVALAMTTFDDGAATAAFDNLRIIRR